MIKTLGGSLKGAVAASPLKAIGTGLGVGSIGAIEKYFYCKQNGDSHKQALRSAAINGSIDGLTAGTFKWLEDKITQRKVIKSQPKLNPMSEAEIEEKQNFEKTLNDKQKEDFEKFDDCNSELNRLSRISTVECGFKLSAKLILSVLTE